MLFDCCQNVLNFPDRRNTSLRKLASMNFRNLLFVLACIASTTAFGLFDEPKIKRSTSTVEGWNLHVDNKLLREEKAATAKALELLKAQLQEITRVVPSEAVAELQKVPLSPISASQYTGDRMNEKPTSVSCMTDPKTPCAVSSWI